jgi:hypothetical protein
MFHALSGFAGRDLKVPGGLQARFVSPCLLESIDTL